MVINKQNPCIYFLQEVKGLPTKFSNHQFLKSLVSFLDCSLILF